jgi:glycosyltransferase involved in cell wall biosynthesis
MTVRVVLLITDLELGGTPLRIKRLAVALREREIDAHVGCLSPPGPVSQQLQAAGVPTFACNAHNARDLTALARLRRELHNLRPDVIHANLTHANVAARAIGALLRIPVIGSTATIEVERRSHLVLERLTAWRDAAHIVHSAALRDHVARRFGISRERIHVVPPSIRRIALVDRNEARRQLGLPAGAFVIAWAGRFDPVKRVDLLIESIARLSKPESVLVLAGDGVLRGRLEAEAERLGAGGRVRFLGWQVDLAPLLSAADLFALPSLTEGVPNAMLEAMGAGVAVVATDIPALREFAGGNERAWLVKGNTAEAWGNAIRRLIGEPALRDRLAAAGRAWAATLLDPAATAAACLAVYRQVIAKHAGE